MVDNESRMVAQLSALFALQQGLSPPVGKQIRVAALLHDIGKQKIPDEILNKPGKLNEYEFEIIKTHTTLGAEMLKSMQGELGNMARIIAQYHHEWLNAKGYWGVSTKDLPFYLPIVSICDVYIALVSSRPYKGAWTTDEALKHIKNQAGTQFCPALVNDFVLFTEQSRCISAIFGGEADRK
jgi:putative nucleotidyltransferase with HDIG domain